MSRGGPAWRGYFPVGAELTSGQPDQKEGLYFGAELPLDHPHVKAGRRLHGPNLFPEIPGFKALLLELLSDLTELGQSVMRALALSLKLDPDYFFNRYTRDPLILFRIFHYPALAPETALWSVGEHSDYGLLTLFA